ncbi:gap junction protein alpha 10 b isoform X4 [Chiloscyllium plagiosum]|uniref:gap junction protein alpha 10 b isoform X4 n=1 Tax=Chiloscyllium plagiosum TaxID=36176 RepID=UPI001CB7E496|nr:gap junction protein alpha 10 b isoform X4 [Chiloscyllium plagiosum]
MKLISKKKCKFLSTYAQSVFRYLANSSDPGWKQTQDFRRLDPGPHHGAVVSQQSYRVHQKFLQLADEVIDYKTQHITSEQVSSIPAIKVNPFKDQICKVFSRNEQGLFSFEDFLEMISTFSENASLAVKIDYAFRIYDLNGNNYIDQEDIRHIIFRLTNGSMDEADISTLTHYILYNSFLSE